MQEFVGLFIFLILAISFAIMIFLIGNVCISKSMINDKSKMFCGRDILFLFSNGNHEVNFVIYAVMFLIFNVETILLFPFAVIFRKLGFYALVETGIFLLIVSLGLVYALRKNILRWK